MKDFQNAIQYYLLNHEKQKKYLAVVLALSILVTFIVPLILTQSAESMTRNNGILATQLANAAGEVVTVTDEQKKVDLLVGVGSPLAASTVQGTIANADAAYAIGLASQFSVFVLGDFNDASCDSEGRTAVGGAINTSTEYDSSGDFDVGSGDYASKTTLESLLGLTGYADVIAGSTIKNLSPFSNEPYKDQGGETKYYNPKVFAVNANGTIQLDTLKGVPDVSPASDPQYYRTDTNLIDFVAEFDKLTLRSQKLSERETEETQILYTNTKEIIYENGNWVKSYEQATTEPNSSDRWSTTVHFVYTGDETDVVVFDLTQAEWDTMVSKAAHQSFEGIPEGAYVIINIDGETINIGGDYRFYYLNGEQISAGTNNTFNGITASHGTGDHAVGNTDGNNDYRCSYFLYNFPNATELKIYNNFSGTILAPNAIVKGENKGHLSGALVAKSFEGNFEFGYRPYTGPYSLLGSTSGYTIPVDKFKTDGETHLAGADFSLTITDESGTVVSSWKSGEDTEYVTIPTMIDFTGGVTYTNAADDDTTNDPVQSRIYTIKEVNAPAGYIGTTKEYRLQVTETVDLDSMIAGEGNGTIPTKVDVEIIITPVEGNTAGEATTLSFKISDEYSEDSQTMRKITIDGKQFWLVIEDQKVVGLVRPTGEMTTSSYESEGTTTYTETVDSSTTVIHEVTKTEVASTEVPVTLEGGEVSTNESNETSMTRVVATTGFNTADADGSSYTSYSTLTQVVTGTKINSYVVTVAGGSTVTEVVTDESGNPKTEVVTDENGNPVTETVMNGDEESSEVTVTVKVTTEVTAIEVESSALTDISIEVGMFTSSYMTSTDKTYIIYTNIPVTESLVADTAVLASKGILNFGDTTETETRYYFDPNSLMLMPMPANNLEFINEYGFQFKKVDEDGNLVTGATIALEKKLAEGAEDTSTENGNIASDGYEVISSITASSLTLDPKNFEENTLYRFRETVVPDGYEPAETIYLVKDGTGSDAKIYYCTSASEPTTMPTAESSTGWTMFRISAPDGSRVISMTDQKIHGYKLVLNKADANTKKLLNGAYFNLCAANGTLVYPTVNLYTDDASTTDVDESQQAGFKIDGTLNLFEELKDAAENTYDSNYVEDGYLKKGTYYLAEVKAPDGYEQAGMLRFKINYENGEYSMEILSSDTPQYFVVEGVSTTHGTEIWANVTATDVSKIEIKVSSPVDGGKIVLYQDTGKTGYNLHDIRADVVNGVATFEFADPLSSIFEFKICNGNDWNAGVTVEEVRVYGTESDGSSSSGSSGSGSTGGTAYKINDIVWTNENVSTVNIDKLTFYYQDGSSSYIENVERNGGNNYWDTLKLGNLSKDNVIGVKFETSGTGTFKLVIQEHGTWANIWEQNVTAGQPYTFGTIPTASTTSPEPTEPSESTTTAVVNAAPLETNESGELVIPNSRLGVNMALTVQKAWQDDESYGSFARPDSITVELKRQKPKEGSTTEYEDDTSFSQQITLNAENEWSYVATLQRLINPADSTDNSTYRYYVKEIGVPEGYIVTYENNTGTDSGGIIQIKNKLEPISLNVEKTWNAPAGTGRPASINVKLQYYDEDESIWKDVPDSTQSLTGSEWKCTYSDLPSGYKYRAVEVKVPTGWIASNNGQSNESSTNGETLTITNTLLTGKLNLMKKWANGAPSSGSIKVKLYRATVRPGTGGGSGGSSGGGSAEGDTTGGNIEVADDAVVARFLYQKGNGDTDHSTYWGPPENQPSRANQLYWTTNSASDIAADYAATLAQFAVNFPDDDKSENYLNAAKALYDFSTQYNSCATEYCSGFYPAKSCTDEQAWAAAWLYLATNDTTYKTACESKLSQCGNPEQRGYFWDDVMLGAEAVYAAHIDDSPSWTKVTNYLNTYCTGDSFRVLDEWGSARHNALLQTLALVTDKNMNTTSYQAWCKNQMAFILGNNNYNRNFVVGFADNSIKNPHHKAATGKIVVDTVNGIGWDTYWNSWNGVFGEESHVLVGALASGPRNNRVNDSCRDPEGNEVALDYNAGLVGAAAGLYSVYGTGTLVNNGADIDSEVESKYDGFAVTRQPNNTNNITEDYSRLLQYSLYFYDANMCGDFTEENSAFSWRSACHTDDEVDGGFHDAGDHVMFGLPQGFSASTLGWVYYEFRDSFDSLGQTAHYKTIMEEFCDFFVDSIEFAETSQQTLTLRSTTTQQSQKATSIKGISMVGSDVKAKGAALTVTGGTIGDNKSEFLIDIAALSAGDKIDISFTGNNGKYTAQFADSSWTFQNYSEDIPANTPTTITLEIGSGWTSPLYIRNYYYTGTLPTITASVHDDGPVFGLKTTSATLKLGESITLETENATDGGTVSWTSSHPDYVTVANGVVQAVKYTPNEVTITAKDESSGSTATAKITVSPMTISGVNTNQINIGDEVTATIGNPGYGDAITWKASPEDAAAVKDGTASKTGATFVAYKAGTFTIVATDGNSNTATSQQITVNGMTFQNNYSTSLNIGGQTTITLGNPGFGAIGWKVTDSNGNELNGIATVTDSSNTAATITANKGGDFYVTATDANGNFVTSDKIHVNGPSITAPDPITEGQTGTITIGSLTGNYTVTVSNADGSIQLTTTDNGYSFTAPDVDIATQYTISVVMEGATDPVVTKVITVNPFAITQDGAVVTEYSSNVTLTANAPATWTVQDGYSGNITLTPSSDRMSCVVNGLEYTSDTITVTATYRENSDTAAITMSMSNSLNISIEGGKTAIRIGDTVTLNAVPNNNVTYYFDPADRVQFDESTMQITALTEGQVTINAKRGENTWAQQPITLTIHPALTLTGDDTMNAGETQTLQVAGNIGTVTWEIIEEDPAGSLTLENGMVTANTNGVTTIKVTDTDGATATFEITIKQTAVNANIPDGAVQIATITISKGSADSGDEWTYCTTDGVALTNLPLTDGNGNTYYYYIEEILDGNETLVTGNAVYIPSEYVNNGAVPSENGNTISVENTKISDVQSDGQMPSAGGEGTTWYYIAGAAMMLAGIAGYFVLKRKQESER